MQAGSALAESTARARTWLSDKRLSSLVSRGRPNRTMVRALLPGRQAASVRARGTGNARRAKGDALPRSERGPGGCGPAPPRSILTCARHAPKIESTDGEPMRRSLTLAAFAWALLGREPARAADLLPLDQVRPGMIGVGRTVFEGTRIDEFQVRLLGVLANAIGPKQSGILARLARGPLDKTGT